MTDSAGVLARARNPAYTGENRCLPCTVVNLVIALVVSGAVGLLAPALGVVAFVASVLAIYLRGYLVPGTPALTKRYLPERVAALFGAHPASTRDETVQLDAIEDLEYRREHAVDTSTFLVSAGAVVGDDDGRPLDDEHGRPRLTPAFAAALEEQVGAARSDLADGVRDDPAVRERLARLFDADPDEVTPADRDYPAISVGNRVRNWPGVPALVSDAAVNDALAAWADDWAPVPLDQRLEMVESLRGSHDACPACGGDLGSGTQTVESCCATVEVAAIVCEDCGGHLLEESVASSGKLTRR